MCSWSSGLWVHVPNSDACLCPGKHANKTPSSSNVKTWATLFSVSLLILSSGQSLKTTQLKYHAGMEKKTILFLLYINQNIALFAHNKNQSICLHFIRSSSRVDLKKDSQPRYTLVRSLLGDFDFTAMHKATPVGEILSSYYFIIWGGFRCASIS